MDQDTKIETKYGEVPIKVKGGVRQGDVISPTIFILYIAPLLWNLVVKLEGYKMNGIKISSSAYADDLVTMTSVAKEVKVADDIVKSWCKTVDMAINPEKSAISWRASEEPEIPEYPSGKDGSMVKIIDLKDSEPYKYLGLWIDTNLDWSHQMSASKSSYELLIGIITRKRYLSPYNQIRLINAVVQTTIAYRMQFIMYPEKFLVGLEELTFKLLKISTRIHARDMEFFWCELGLNNLTVLNRARYVGTRMNRGFRFGISPLKEIFEKELVLERDLMNLQFDQNGDRYGNFRRKIKDEHDFLPLVNEAVKPLRMLVINRNQLVLEANKLKSTFTLPFLDTSNRGQIDVRTKIYNDKAAEVWTDGGKNRNTIFCSGFIGFQEEESNVKVVPTQSIQNSYEAEIQAAELALGSYAEADVKIFSDNLNVVNTINNYKKITEKFLSKSNQCMAIRRLIKLIAEREKRGIETSAYHTFSHLLEDMFMFKMDPEKKIKKIEIMKERFSLKWLDIVRKNQMIDRLISRDESKTFPKWSIKDTGMPNYYIVQGEDNLVTGSASLAIKSLENKIIRFNWLQKCSKSNKIQVHPESDWKMIRNFLLYQYGKRAQTGFLTLSMYEQLNTAKRMNKNGKGELTGNDCLFCRSRGLVICESHEHFFHKCPKVLELKTKLAREILELVNAKATKEFNLENFPWWFSISPKVFLNNTKDPIVDRIRSYREFGDKGGFPKSMEEFLRNAGIEKTKSVVREIYSLQIEHFTNIWTLRVENAVRFLKKYKKDLQKLEDDNIYDYFPD